VKADRTLLVDRNWLAAFLVLTAASLGCHLTGFGPIGLVVLPFAFLFLEASAFNYLILGLAGFLFFFEGHLQGSNVDILMVPDVLLLTWLALSLLTKRETPFLFKLPTSKVYLLLYAYVGYGLLLSIHPIFKYGLDTYVFRDIRNLLYLLLAIPLANAARNVLSPKRTVYLLMAFGLFSGLHGILLFVQLLLTEERSLTWNEALLGDGAIISLLTLRIVKTMKVRLWIYAGLIGCVLGLLATQTRGIWLATSASIGVFVFLNAVRDHRTFIPKALKVALVGLVLLAAAETAMRITRGSGILGFVGSRMTQISPTELVDPYSSLGYRLHESYEVWLDRSTFGHGSGARLRLFFTQMSTNKIMDWWSIHSQYFEVLHKYGFVGLAIFLSLFLSLGVKSFRISRSSKRFISTIGFVVLLCLINHSIVSITSRYLIRDNVMLAIALFFALSERYSQRPRRG
jgi:O-Antigen ligase